MHPDGRALYAYRCTGQEFETLTESLKQSAPLSGLAGDAVVRAFVLYAAEWWQRRYDGRHWAWEPLLASIGWYSVHYPELYETRQEGLGVVEGRSRGACPTSIRLSRKHFACQGGLPLALVGDAGSRITHYLRAVSQAHGRVSAIRRRPDRLGAGPAASVAPADVAKGLRVSAWRPT